MWADEWSALSAWCVTELGAEPVREMYGRQLASQVAGVELADGRRVVVKTRRDENGRAASCVAAQLALSEQGFPCARPITPVTFDDGQARHAEEWKPDGEIRVGDDPSTAAAFGALFARAQSLTEQLTVPPPLPNPSGVRWADPVAFPQLWWQEPWVLTAPMPELITSTTARVRDRLADCALSPMLGHADWETQNIRWHGSEPYVVHDWDSLAWLPEAALVGLASGTFASNEDPTLAPIESSSAFIYEYQSVRSRSFSREETEIAWAASLWPAVYNARTQLMYDRPAVALWALEKQADDRLLLASA